MPVIRSFNLLAWSLFLLAGPSASAAENVLRAADFSALETGSGLERPWQTSDGDEGITVRIGSPENGDPGKKWIEFQDQSGAASSSATLRQQFEPIRSGRLSLRLHIPANHEGEIGIYLGVGEASSTADRIIDAKTNQRGVLRIGSRGDRQSTPLVLEAGETHHFFIQFISANRDQFLLFVVDIYDENGGEEVLARIEAGHPPAPVTGLRITTDNAPSGAHFYVTDLLLVKN